MKILLSVCYYLLILQSSAADELKSGLVKLSGCTCPGYTTILECTILSGLGGATVWKGSAFDCTKSDNEIVLLHSRFGSDEGTRRSCNNGTIFGKAIKVKESYYISQLHVTVSPDIIGGEIECANDDSTMPMEIGSSAIEATTVPFGSPEGVSITRADLGSRQLTFTWSPVAPDCPAIHYNILASNCGSCPTTTTYNIVTCTNIPIDGSVCMLAVQSAVCGNITGNFSKSIQGVMKGNSGCIGATVAAGLFSIISVVCVIALSALLIIIFVKRKTHDHHEAVSHRTMTRSTPSIYGHILHRRPASINTKSNVAYGPSVNTPTIDQAQQL